MSTETAKTSAGLGLVGDYTYGVATKKPGEGARAAGSDLDKDAFLRLLMVQLQYQDPMNPMEDREFIAQMAQFSALEQMQNMNSAYSKSQAYEMIGREVSGLSFDEGSNMYTEVRGIVTGVKIIAGEPYLEVRDGDKTLDLALKRVESVSEDLVRLSLLESMNNNIANQQYLTLVGQEIQAVTVDANGKPNGYVEGKVTSVRFGTGGTTLVVGNREVKPAEVISIGPDNALIGARMSYFMFSEAETKTVQLHGTIQEIRINGDIMYMVFRDGSGKDHRVDFKPLDGLVKALSMKAREAYVAGNNGTRDVEGYVKEVGVMAGQVYVVLNNGDMLLWNSARETTPPAPGAEDPGVPEDPPAEGTD